MEPTDADPAQSTVLHASCVAVNGRGLLILGPSGAGKSGLALQLMALGAGLVADDRTILTRQGAGLVASCPQALHGLIEARGLGLLRAQMAPETRVVAVVDLAQTETERLPPLRQVTILGCDIDLVRPVPNAHFIAGLMHYLIHGRQEP